VVCGGIAPLLLSVTWLILVRYFVGVITWLTIILLNVFTLLVTLFFYIKAGWIGKDAVTAVVGSGANNVLSSSTTVSTSPFTDESQSFMLEHLV
jgi:hypothetical protein